MLLTISTTHQPATDLGFLLHKNQSRIQTFPLNFGSAQVFYPDVTDEKCTVALLLEKWFWINLYARPYNLRQHKLWDTTIEKNLRLQKHFDPWREAREKYKR